MSCKVHNNVQSLGRCGTCRKMYYNTPQGKAETMWGGITQRALNKDSRHPAYTNIEIRITKKDFIKWAIRSLDKWCIDNSLSDASIDRIDNDKHYSIDNLQILHKLENARKRSFNRNVNAPEGMAWCSKCKTYLHIDSFHKDKSRFNGLQNACKKHKRCK